jgi:uncharacterized protein YraI
MLTAAGCAVDESAADEGVADDSDALTQVPTLTFNTDGTVTQSAPLVAGGNVRIKYSQSRLRTCTGNVNGAPGWAITGYASLAGAAATSWDTGRVSGSTRVAVNQVIALPRSGTLALWFQQTNRWGCQAWDSRAGMNYRFAVQLPTGGVTPPVSTEGPTLTFHRDGTVSQTGTLAVGQRLRVRYAQDRIASCTGTTMGNAAWAITGFASLNGAAARSFETGVAATGGTRTTVDASVELTAAGDLALWFQQTNRWGCQAWDSRNGQNYHFSVALR